MAAPKAKPEDRNITSQSTGPDDDPRFIAVAQGQSRRKGIAIPEAAPGWMPEARSWFNSLKLSGQSDFYEASDWATAVAAAKAYDIFLRTYNASILNAFVRLSERLGVTIVDRKRSRIELDDPEPQDDDEDAAYAAVSHWQGHLGLVVNNERQGA
jgi:hypothetical protein